jgi:hypothetical protein
MTMTKGRLKNEKWKLKIKNEKTNSGKMENNAN